MCFVVETVDAADVVYRRTNFTLGAYPANVIAKIRTEDHVKHPALGLANALTAPEETILRRLVLAYLLQNTVRVSNTNPSAPRSDKDRALINKETAAYAYALSAVSESAREWLVGPYDDPINYPNCLLHMAMFDIGVNFERGKQIKKIIRDMGAKHANIKPGGKYKNLVSDVRAVYAWIGGARQVIAEVMHHYNDFDTLWRRGIRSVQQMHNVQNHHKQTVAVTSTK